MLYTRRNNLGVFIDNNISSNNLTLIQTLTSAIQSLPDNFGRVLSQVQNYTRTNIIPFVQSYNPRRLSDLIWIKSQPNNIMKIEKNKTNVNKARSQNFSITWSTSKDFNEIARNSVQNISNISITNLLPNLKINNGSLNRKEISKDENLEQNDKNPESLNYIQPNIVQNITDTTKNIPTNIPLTTTTVPSDKTFPNSKHPDVSTKHFVPPTIIAHVSKYTNDTKLLSKDFNSTLIRKGAPLLANVSKTSINHMFIKNTPASNIFNLTEQEISTSNIDNITLNINESSKNINLQKTDSNSLLNYTESHILQDVTNEIEGITTLKSISTTIPLSEATSASPKFVRVSTNFVSNNNNNNNKIKNVISEKSVLNQISVNIKLANISQEKNHIQRIPRRGEVIEYILPQPFTIVIDPIDLTTITPMTSSTTSNSQIWLNRKFSSYIQKIPRRGNRKVLSEENKSPEKWTKYFNVGNRFISAKNKLGTDVTYQITSDGRFEV